MQKERDPFTLATAAKQGSALTSHLPRHGDLGNTDSQGQTILTPFFPLSVGLTARLSGHSILLRVRLPRGTRKLADGNPWGCDEFSSFTCRRQGLWPRGQSRFPEWIRELAEPVLPTKSGEPGRGLDQEGGLTFLDLRFR